MSDEDGSRRRSTASVRAVRNAEGVERRRQDGGTSPGERPAGIVASGEVDTGPSTATRRRRGRDRRARVRRVRVACLAVALVAVGGLGLAASAALLRVDLAGTAGRDPASTAATVAAVRPDAVAIDPALSGALTVAGGASLVVAVAGAGLVAWVAVTAGRRRRASR